MVWCSSKTGQEQHSRIAFTYACRVDFQVFHDDDGQKYRVIDTPGLCDTITSDQEVLLKIADGIQPYKSVHAVLFAVRGRLTAERANVYKLVRDFILGKGMDGVASIVRTGFDRCTDPEACHEDTKAIQSCAAWKDIVEGELPVVHTSCPPMAASEKWQEVRQNSRRAILAHLKVRERSVVEVHSHDKIVERVKGMVTVEEELRLLAEKHERMRLEEEKLRREVEETRRKADAEKERLAAVQRARAQIAAAGPSIPCSSCASPLASKHGSNTTIHASINFGERGVELQCSCGAVARPTNQQLAPFGLSFS